MRVLVVGAGSIGIYLGCKLLSGGHDVVILGRSKLREVHDTIIIDDKDYLVPKKIYTFPKGENFDIIFVTSKLYDFESNLKKIEKAGIKGRYLYSIQNGLVDNSKYCKYLNNYLFGTVSIFEGFRLLENQLLVSYSRRGWKTDNSKEGQFLRKILVDSGIRLSCDKNLLKIKAEKMLMNCSINLLSAIEKKTFFEICKNVKLKRRMDLIFDESYLVLSKIVKISPKSVIKKLFYSVVSSMKHYSSTYQDAVAGKKTEVDFLNGYIIGRAKDFGIRVPESERLVKQFLQ